MSTNVFAWNVRDGFTNPSIDLRLLEDAILSHDPDIAVFPEARSEFAELADSTVTRFEREGYAVYDTDYSDEDARADRHGLVMLARPELVESMQVVRLAGRNAIHLSLMNETGFIGAHFVDRTVTEDGHSSIGGEDQRVAQAKEAIAFLLDRSIIAGDLNATHREGFTPRALRAVGPLTELLPSLDPRPGLNVPKLKRLGSLAQRLTNMASGSTLQILESAEYIDADTESQPTMTKGPFKVQLDHILARNVPIAQPTKVGPKTELSDHRYITAMLDI